jgi:hypothetical protein
LIENIDASRTNVRKFGYLFAGVGVVITAFLLLKGSEAWIWPAAGGGVFLILGLIAYPLLRPVYIGWMAIAFVLGWINTRLLLGLFFVVVLTPAGVLMRLFGNDPLSRSIDRGGRSYWIPKEDEVRGKERYTRLF